MRWIGGFAFLFDTLFPCWDASFGFGDSDLWNMECFWIIVMLLICSYLNLLFCKECGER